MYGTGFYNEPRLLSQQRWSRSLRLLALTFLGLWFSIAPSAAQAAQVAATSKVHIYLLRGGLNIFSLGMDEIAAKLQQVGLHATVHNHLVWRCSQTRPRRITRAGAFAPSLWSVTPPVRVQLPA
jgi:hypothetical protein